MYLLMYVLMDVHCPFMYVFMCTLMYAILCALIYLFMCLFVYLYINHYYILYFLVVQETHGVCKEGISEEVSSVPC